LLLAPRYVPFLLVVYFLSFLQFLSCYDSCVSDM
jgi:hypothetical protein